MKVQGYVSLVLPYSWPGARLAELNMEMVLLAFSPVESLLANNPSLSHKNNARFSQP